MGESDFFQIWEVGQREVNSGILLDLALFGLFLEMYFVMTLHVVSETLILTHTCIRHTHVSNTNMHPSTLVSDTHLHPTHTCTRHTHAPDTHTLVTQPMLQLRPNWSELRSMDCYHQIFYRFRKCKQKLPPPSPLSTQKSPFTPPKDKKNLPFGG